MRRYEGLFLFDNQAAHDWNNVETEVKRLCGRIGAELQVCVKFDERKLAYEIDGRKRGTYVLTIFDAPPDRITDLERDARLSEVILRSLVLRDTKHTPEKVAELKAWPPEKPLAPMGGGEGRRDDRDRDGRDRDGRDGRDRDGRDRDRGDRDGRGGGRDRGDDMDGGEVPDDMR